MIEWTEVGPPELVLEHDKIGGSSLGILMGLAGYGGQPLDVFNRIVHHVIDRTPNVYTERGNRYEPVVRRLFVEQTKAVLLPHPGILFLEDCFAATLDDLAQRDGIAFPVDYKTASNSKANLRKWGPSGSDKFPEQYRAQLILYMACTAAPFSELFVAFGEDVKSCGTPERPACVGRHKCHTGEFNITECRRYFLNRDFAQEEKALAIGRKFWREHILTKIPPQDENQNLTEALTLNLDAADMLIFDSLMASTPAAPPKPPEPPPAPPPPLKAAEPVVYGACPQCSQQVTNMNGSRKAEKFFHIECPGRPLVASSPTEPASILPPDAPASHPELAAECPHCPPDKSGHVVQHLLKDCPTLNKPAEVAKPEKAKRGRPRKNLQIIDVAAGETEAQATARVNAPALMTVAEEKRQVSEASADGAWYPEKAPTIVHRVVFPEGTTGDQIAEAFAKVRAAPTLENKVAALEAGVSSAKVLPETAVPDAEIERLVRTNGGSEPDPTPTPTPAPQRPPQTIQLFVDAEPGPGLAATRLEPYVAMLARKLAELYQCDDIRASDHKALGFTKWKGALAAAARKNPPPAGAYVIRDDPEFGTIVVQALAPFCLPGFPVRGVR